MRVDEAARRLGASPSNVYRWIREGYPVPSDTAKAIGSPTVLLNAIRVKQPSGRRILEVSEEGLRMFAKTAGFRRATPEEGTTA